MPPALGEGTPGRPRAALTAVEHMPRRKQPLGSAQVSLTHRVGPVTPVIGPTFTPLDSRMNQGTMLCIECGRMDTSTVGPACQSVKLAWSGR